MLEKSGERPRRKTVLELVEEAKSLTMDPASALGELAARYDRKIRWLALRMISQRGNTRFRMGPL